jgi:hypothetical protein
MRPKKRPAERTMQLRYRDSSGNKKLKRRVVWAIWAFCAGAAVGFWLNNVFGSPAGYSRNEPAASTR